MIGSNKSHMSTIIATACLLLAACTQSNSQVGQTARPVTRAPAEVATAGPSAPRVAEPAAKPVEMAGLPAEATAVESAPPKPKPRQHLARTPVQQPAQKLAQNPARKLAKPAPPAAKPATIEIKPAAGPTAAGPSAVAKPPMRRGTVVAGRTPVDPAPETGPPIADSSAVEVIGRLGRMTMAVLSDPAKSPAERQKFFQELLADQVDIPMLAKFLAGRHWRRASAAQRTAYVSAFTDFMLQVFARQLGGAELDAFEVLGSKPAGRRDVMVMSRLHRGGKPVEVEWRLRRRDNRFLVIDVTAEGVSMALTRRQEFAAIIRANGGRFDSLITKLREFVSKAS